MASRKILHKAGKSSKHKSERKAPPVAKHRITRKASRPVRGTKKSGLFWKLFKKQKDAGLAMQPPRTPQRVRNIRSQLDELLELVNEKGRITLNEISSKFKIDHALAESWAKILEDAKLAELHYPAVGEPDLTKAGYDEEQKKAVEKKKAEAKAKPFFNFSFGSPKRATAAVKKPVIAAARKRSSKPNKGRRKGIWPWKF
jgi:hypothetical protein